MFFRFEIVSMYALVLRSVLQAISFCYLGIPMPSSDYHHRRIHEDGGIVTTSEWGDITDLGVAFPFWGKNTTPKQENWVDPSRLRPPLRFPE